MKNNGKKKRRKVIKDNQYSSKFKENIYTAVAIVDRMKLLHKCKLCMDRAVRIALK